MVLFSLFLCFLSLALSILGNLKFLLCFPQLTAFIIEGSSIFTDDMIGVFQKWSSEKLKISYHDDDDDLAFRVLFQFLLNFCECVHDCESDGVFKLIERIFF